VDQDRVLSVLWGEVMTIEPGALFLEDLQDMAEEGCQNCGMEHLHHLVLKNRCHSKAGLVVTFHVAGGGCLVMTCQKCNAFVARVQVEKRN
jgi:hypothetical protein